MIGTIKSECHIDGLTAFRAMIRESRINPTQHMTTTGKIENSESDNFSYHGCTYCGSASKRRISRFVSVSRSSSDNVFFKNSVSLFQSTRGMLIISNKTGGT